MLQFVNVSLISLLIKFISKKDRCFIVSRDRRAQLQIFYQLGP